MAENNFDVENSASVDEAFKKMERQTYDAIISDYEMSQKNGLDFLRALREKNNQIPFILFTGKGREDVAIKALNLGADAYISKQGEPETVFGELSHYVCQAVSKKQVEVDLHKSEAELKAQFNGSPDQIFILDRAYKFVRINRTRYGFGSTEKLIGQDSIQFLQPCSRDEAKTKIDQCFETGAIQEFEADMGKGRWAKARIVPLKTFDSINHVMVIATETTDRKKSEESLRESEAKYEELVNTLPAAIFEIDDKANVVFANPKACEITGYSLEDARKGLSALKLVSEKDRERVKRNIGRAMVGINFQGNEYIFVRKDGSEFPVIVNAIPIAKNGKIVGLRGIITDTSERKNAEKAVKQSEIRFRSLYENSFDAILLTKPKGSILSANPAACRMFDMSEEEIRTADRSGLLVLDERVEVAIKERELNGKAKAELTFCRKDGSTFEGETTSSIFIDSDGITKTSMIIRDITEHKKAETDLRTASLYSRSLLEASLDPLVTINKQGKITDVNEATELVTGYSREELIGSDFSDYFIEPDLARIGYRKVFTDGLVKDYPLSIKHKSGKVTDVLYNASIYRNSQGEIEGVFAAARDITERKKN